MRETLKTLLIVLLVFSAIKLIVKIESFFITETQEINSGEI